MQQGDPPTHFLFYPLCLFLPIFLQPHPNFSNSVGEGLARLHGEADTIVIDNCVEAIYLVEFGADVQNTHQLADSHFPKDPSKFGVFVQFESLNLLLLPDSFLRISVLIILQVLEMDGFLVFELKDDPLQATARTLLFSLFLSIALLLLFVFP